MKAGKPTTANQLLSNARFYVLTASIIISLLATAWLRLQIPSDQLLYIRLEQVFGFLGAIYLYVAVLISPLSKVLGKNRAMNHLLFARRAIGVSAAYFAGLHAGVAFWGQLGGLQGMPLLPERFKWSLLFGAAALIVLIAMAVTSFDKVIAFMTLRRWRWLHRLVYGSGVLVILHVWMIGTHIVYPWVRVTAFIALGVFFGLESWRVANNLAKRDTAYQEKEFVIAITLAMWLFWIWFLLFLPSLVKNYHREHQNHPDNSAFVAVRHV